MVVPVFGFSAGDFVAAVEVLTKAAKSLKEVSGAAAQYRQAAADLNQLLLTLRLVQSLEPSSTSQHIIEKVQLCSHACHIPLARFLQKLKKFEVLSMPGNWHSAPTTSLVRGSRKIQWALLVEHELAKLRAFLAPQLATIEILLHLSSVEQISNVREATTKTCEDLGSLLSKLDGLKSCLSHHTATKDQCASLYSLIGDLSSQQMRSEQTLLSSADRTESTTQQILAVIRAQETALKALQCKIDGHLSPATRPSAGVETLPWQPSLKPSFPASEHGRTHHPIQEQFVIAQAHRLLLAVRKGVAEVFLMLLCFLPAVRRFFRTLIAFANSPTLLLESNITLEDALGRVLSFPFEHFRYWPVLEARLRAAFSGLPGEELVARMQYHIVDLRDEDRSILTKKTWKKTVRPGSSLAMSFLYRRRCLEGCSCPRCSYENPSMSNRWVKCLGCSLTYRTLETKPRSASLISGSQVYEDIMDGVQFVDPDFVEAQSREGAETTEMDHFKRIHLISTLPMHHEPAESGINSVNDFLNSDDEWNLSAGSTHGADSTDDWGEDPEQSPDNIDWSGADIMSSHAGPYSKNRDRPKRVHLQPHVAEEYRNLPKRARAPRWLMSVDTGSDADEESEGEDWSSSDQPGVSHSRRIRRRDWSTIFAPEGKNNKDPSRNAKKPNHGVSAFAEISKEGVAAMNDSRNISSGARWTRIDRRLVNSKALKEAKEKFEERRGCVIVFRLLTKQEIHKLADRTFDIRGGRP